jgi:uncharacterized membrane protein YgcG
MKNSHKVFLLVFALMVGDFSLPLDAQNRRGSFRNRNAFRERKVAADSGSAAPAIRRAFPVRRRVLDGAEILLPEQERDLEGKIWKFENETHKHVAILIAKQFEKGKAGKFFNLLANKNRISPEERANSVLILVFVNQRVGRIEVGDNLESALPVPLRRQIIQQRIMRRIGAGQFYGAVNAGLLGVMKAIKPDFQPYQAIEAQGTVLVNPKMIESRGDTIHRASLLPNLLKHVE